MIFFPRSPLIPNPPKPIRRGDPVPVDLRPMIHAAEDIGYFENRPMTGPELMKLRSRFGDRVVFYSGQTLSVALFNWNDVKRVLSSDSSDFIKGPFESVIGAGVGWGLLTQEGSEHTRQRHKFNPSFHSSAMHLMSPQIEHSFAQLRPTFASESGFEVLASLRKLTHQITLRGILGVLDMEADERFEKELFVLARFMTQGSFPTNSTSEMGLDDYVVARDRFLEHVDDITKRIVAGTNIAESSFGDYLGKEHSGPISRGEGTHAQVAQFLSAGTETTASLIASMLYLHTQTPDDWQNLRRAAEASDSFEFDARLDEALRLFPPAAISTRVPIKPVELEGMTLPTGIQVFISPYVTHRIDEYFENPHVYHWERWLTSDRARGVGYFPFGFGPRMCIGYSAARHTAKKVLRLFLSTFNPRQFQKMPDFSEQFIVLGPKRSERLFFADL